MTTTTIISKDAEGKFRTSPAAAWLPALCDKLAAITVDHYLAVCSKALASGGETADVDSCASVEISEGRKELEVKRRTAMDL